MDDAGAVAGSASQARARSRAGSSRNASRSAAREVNDGVVQSARVRLVRSAMFLPQIKRNDPYGSVPIRVEQRVWPCG
jgi:hypothetical protein